VDSEIIRRAVILHGHYGPSLMLGLKAYLYAKSILGEVSKCVVKTVGRRPYLCVLDGIKVSSKCKIDVEEGYGLAFTFFNESQRLEMSLKTKLFSKYYNKPWKELERLANEVVSKDAADLFDIIIP
jgi:formylmethanofuran dehydrogenase subunit E